MTKSKTYISSTKVRTTCDYCGKSHVAKGMCRFHYDRARRGVDFAKPVQLHHSPYRDTPCAELGCPDLAKVKGYCRPHAEHYRHLEATRARKGGGPRRYCLEVDCPVDLTFEHARRKRCRPHAGRRRNEVATAAMARLHDTRKQAGLCGICGREPRYEHRVRCEQCTVKLSQYGRDRIANEE